jgi:hypothetical protein
MIHVHFKEGYDQFKMETLSAFDGWVYDFSFSAQQTKNSKSDTLYFIYPEKKCTNKVLSKGFDIHCTPFEFLYASTSNQTGNSKIILLDRVNKSQEIALESHGRCFGESVTDYFYANITIKGKRRTIERISYERETYIVPTCSTTVMVCGDHLMKYP